MRAIRVGQFGGAEVLRLEEVDAPEVGRGQVLVRVRAVGVNPVDTYIRSGTYAVKPTLPYTPGADAAGLVEATGEGVTRVRVGDRVYVAGSQTGTYAELTLCDETQVHALPDRLTYGQGAAVGIPYVTAYRALFMRAQAKAGETVLVHGASGGVGVAAVQLARAAGLTVYATAGTERGLELVRAEGAHHALNHRAPDYLEELKMLTGGAGVNVVLEMLANVNLGKDLEVLARRGRVVIVGSRGTVEINPRAAMMRDADILGMTLMNVTAGELLGIHTALVDGLENGTLRPIVGRELPLEEASRAHEAVLESGSYGKIILIP
ncbi:MAG TPA: NADPH:quinone reductase [Pyrinomonadaceae bacterium]|nr:NADPH:quinone reductase [Pyrinomonadaceae bacterium]